MEHARGAADRRVVERPRVLSVHRGVRVLRESSRPGAHHRADHRADAFTARRLQRRLSRQLPAERIRRLHAGVRADAPSWTVVCRGGRLRLRAVPPVASAAPSAPVVVLDAGCDCRAAPVYRHTTLAMGRGFCRELAAPGARVRLLFLLPHHLGGAVARMVRAAAARLARCRTPGRGRGCGRARHRARPARVPRDSRVVRIHAERGRSPQLQRRRLRFVVGLPGLADVGLAQCRRGFRVRAVSRTDRAAAPGRGHARRDEVLPPRSGNDGREICSFRLEAEGWWQERSRWHVLVLRADGRPDVGPVARTEADAPCTTDRGARPVRAADEPPRIQRHARAGAAVDALGPVPGRGGGPRDFAARVTPRPQAGRVRGSRRAPPRRVAACVPRRGGPGDARHHYSRPRAAGPSPARERDRDDVRRHRAGSPGLQRL